MNLLEKATTITTATAYDNGKLHSVKGGSVADFDVVRGSLATRVNSEGLIEDISTLSGELITGGNDTFNVVGLADNQNITIQSAFFSIGKTYKIDFEIYDYIEGSIFLLRPSDLGVGSAVSVNGQYTYTIEANTSTSLIFRTDGLSTTLKLRSISVKEVIDATNIPRIDYSTGEGVILTEPQSTNLITQSEDFTSWNSYEATSNTTTSPSGNSVLFLDFEDARMFPTNSVASGVDYTSSIYLKANKVADVKIRNARGQDTIFTLTTDWVRYELTSTTNSTSTNALLIDARFSQGLGASGLEIALWGAQLEEQSYSTSYIPTSGAIATRLADSITGAGSTDLINSEEGVLYAEIAALADDLTFRGISLNDGTNTNSIGLRYRTTSNRVNVIIKDGNGVNLQMFVDVSDITQFNKIALRYKSGDVSMYINGTEVATSSLAFSFTSALNDFSFDRGDGNDDFLGKTKTVAVFSEALSDEELTCLTTI